jgi:hypothetical protein
VRIDNWVGKVSAQIAAPRFQSRAKIQMVEKWRTARMLQRISRRRVRARFKNIKCNFRAPRRQPGKSAAAAIYLPCIAIIPGKY